MNAPDFEYCTKEDWDPEEGMAPVKEKVIEAVKTLYAIIPDDFPPSRAAPIEAGIETWIEVEWPIASGLEDDHAGIMVDGPDSYIFSVQLGDFGLSGVTSSPETALDIVRRYGTGKV